MTKTGLARLAFLAILAVPCVAGAQGGSNDAKLKPGITLVKNKDYDKAIASLSKVYASTKDPRAIYWIGRAHQDAGRNADALRAYKQYLKEASPTITEPRSIDVLGYIQTLSMQVGTVTITAAEGSTITVDDVEVGKAPLGEALAVDPGKHTIAATLDGKTAAKQIDVAQESRSSLDLVVKAEEAKPAAAAKPAASAEAAPAPKAEPTAAPASRASSGSGVDAMTVGGLGIATVLAAGSVFFTIKAAGSASDFEAKKGELGASREDLDSLQSDTRLQTGLAIGLGLAAVGAAGVTLFVLKKPKTETRVGVTGQGVLLSGSF